MKRAFGLWVMLAAVGCEAAFEADRRDTLTLEVTPEAGVAADGVSRLEAMVRVIGKRSQKVKLSTSAGHFLGSDTTAIEVTTSAMAEDRGTASVRIVVPRTDRKSVV